MSVAPIRKIPVFQPSPLKPMTRVAPLPPVGSYTSASSIQYKCDDIVSWTTHYQKGLDLQMKLVKYANKLALLWRLAFVVSFIVGVCGVFAAAIFTSSPVFLIALGASMFGLATINSKSNSANYVKAIGNKVLKANETYLSIIKNPAFLPWVQANAGALIGKFLNGDDMNTVVYSFGKVQHYDAMHTGNTQRLQQWHQKYTRHISNTKPIQTTITGTIVSPLNIDDPNWTTFVNNEIGMLTNDIATQRQKVKHALQALVVLYVITTIALIILSNYVSVLASNIVSGAYVLIIGSGCTYSGLTTRKLTLMQNAHDRLTAIRTYVNAANRAEFNAWSAQHQLNQRGMFPDEYQAHVEVYGKHFSPYSKKLLKLESLITLHTPPVNTANTAAPATT